MLNDLVQPAGGTVIDPVVNQSMLRQIQAAAAGRRREQGDRQRFSQLRQGDQVEGRRKGKKIHTQEEDSSEEEKRISKENELAIRRKKALEDIQEVGKMMEQRKELDEERMRLTRLLGQEGGLDLSISPSSRSLSWWRRRARAQSRRRPKSFQ